MVCDCVESCLHGTYQILTLLHAPEAMCWCPSVVICLFVCLKWTKPGLHTKSRSVLIVKSHPSTSQYSTQNTEYKHTHAQRQLHTQKHSRLIYNSSISKRDGHPIRANEMLWGKSWRCREEKNRDLRICLLVFHLGKPHTTSPAHFSWDPDSRGLWSGSDLYRVHPDLAQTWAGLAQSQLLWFDWIALNVWE